jgi:hypothetical protein
MSEMLVGLTEHITAEGAIEQDEMGFWSARCQCGYLSMPVPDLEILLDEMMSHVSLAVQTALAR